MHIYGRSDILDKLHDQANNPDQPVRYDIRTLSREILQRMDSNAATWYDDSGAKITLEKSSDTQYDSYELLYREANDTDVHQYRYNGFANLIQYDYPIHTRQQDVEHEEKRSRVEQVLLTGPVPDKFPSSRVEIQISQTSLRIIGKLVLEHLAESEPDFWLEMRAAYIMATDEGTKREIEQMLHSKTVELDSFSVGPNQFRLALDLEIATFRLNQKQLPRKAESTE